MYKVFLFLGRIHKFDIKFTLEIEKRETLPLFDVNLIKRKNTSLLTEIFIETYDIK